MIVVIGVWLRRLETAETVSMASSGILGSVRRLAVVTIVRDVSHAAAV